MNIAQPKYNSLPKAFLTVFLAALFSLVALGSGYCVNYGDGARCPKGLYLAVYPSWYKADKTTDENGHAAKKHYGMDKYSLSIKPVYYGDDFVVLASIPIGKTGVGYYNDSDAGIGDILLGAGYFLPVKNINILPLFSVKFPTGHFNRNSSVNFGDGQYDFRSEVFINKPFGRFCLDLAFRYWHRFKNSASNFKPGNEFYAEGVATYRLIKKFRLGPSVIFCRGADPELDEVTVANSDIKRVSVGAEFVCGLSEHVQLILDVLPDVYAENTTKGLLVKGRVVYAF